MKPYHFSSKMLNYQELQKQEKDTNYESYHMFNSFLVTRLCFDKGGKTGCNTRHVCNVKGADTFTNANRVRMNFVHENKDERSHGISIKGAMNLFKCKRIIFPVNEDNINSVCFVVDPNRLRQKFYCSLHGKLNKRRTHISQCLRKWILCQHGKCPG